MNKIYFGRYIARSSPIHRINPLMKLIGITVIIALLIGRGNNIYVLIYSSVLFILFAALSRITFKEIYVALKSFRFLFVFIFCTRLLFDTGSEFSLEFSRETIYGAAITAFQFSLFIAFSAMITFTSTPSDISKSLYFFVRPLKIFGIRTENIAVSLLIAVRFIPIIFEETDKIITAQKLRGLWISGKKFTDKIKFIFSTDSLLIPLFARVFNYAEQLSVTISCRSNMGEALKLDGIKTNDILFLSVILTAVWSGYALF
ncbi:MAG: energy-coupling factor transporter transmembrane protein EcfT [Mucispirillum sp.]|nr:energy-coupling factor transporter transmembrane protein EcfT [Mucispirillum sp.]